MEAENLQSLQYPSAPQPVMQPAPRHGLPLFLKILFVLVGIVVLLGLLTGAYILGEKQSAQFQIDGGDVVRPSRTTPTPTPNLTANWQTYVSSTYSINYPNTWKMKADSFNPNAQSFYDPASLIACSPNHCSGSLPTTYVDISTLASSETAKQYADRITSNPLYKNQGSVETPVTFNGISGYIYKDAGEGSQGYIIVVSNGRTLVTINIPYGDITQDATISHMLQSFKFVE